MIWQGHTIYRTLETRILYLQTCSVPRSKRLRTDEWNVRTVTIWVLSVSSFATTVTNWTGSKEPSVLKIVRVKLNGRTPDRCAIKVSEKLMFLTLNCLETDLKWTKNY